MILKEYLENVLDEYCSECRMKSVCSENTETDCLIVDFIADLPKLMDKDVIYEICLEQLKRDYGTVISTIITLEKLLEGK